MTAIAEDSRLRYRCQLRQNAEERSADTHPLTWRLRDDGARVDINEYVVKDGYQAAKLTLQQHTPASVIDTMKQANVRGRVAT